MAVFKQNKGEKTSLRAKLGFKNIDRNIGKQNKADKNKGIDKEDIDASFAYVERELPQYVMDQEEGLAKLVVAFKRPFFMPPNKSYKNMIFIFGPEGSGRKYAVQVVAKLMAIKKIIKSSSIYHLDFADYSSDGTADTLLLPDLYKAFYGTSPIVIIENYEEGCQQAKNYISTLGTEGVLKVDKRYIWKNGQLQDATGSYAIGSSDNLSANDKYIVFVSKQSAATMEHSFPREFLENAIDRIQFHKLSDTAVHEITVAFLDECRSSLKNYTDMVLYYDETLIATLSGMPCKRGVHDIYNQIKKGIYEQVVDKNLHGVLPRGASVSVEAKDGMLFANGILLSRLMIGEDSEMLNKLDAEMGSIIGLDNVKAFIQRLCVQLEFQRRNQHRVSGERPSLHMIFCGNPGTGKTTIARIVAQYLKALGILSSGHLVEASRQDLVAGYVGQTAIKTAQVIRSAMGGVLFIDEAYALSRSDAQGDPFGLEAIDTLVKYIEDSREDLVVILAGYTEEMNHFLKTNPGLKSRFPHIVEFPDYSPEELLEIAEVSAKKKEYTIDEGCKEPLKQYFANQQIPGKNDSGNGRLVRNALESAIANHMNRLAELKQSELSAEQIQTLTTKDFGLEPSDDFDLNRELDEIVGLDNVKQMLRSLNTQLYVEKKRREAGLSTSARQSLNMVFMGNPGTGKTYIARTVARLMKHMEILKSGQLIETDRSGLVGQYLGQTAQKTREVFMSAMGGVLFIDEAYSLSSENMFDKEAIDTLIKLIEDNSGEIVVILAGYRREMIRFMDNNPGLQSRFNISMDFPDYSLDELVEIMTRQAKGKGFTINEDALFGVRKKLSTQMRASEYSGNGRLARNVLEEAIRKQTTRIAREGNFDDAQALVTLKAEDFSEEERQQKEGFDLEKRLSGIIGLEEVKAYIRSLYAMLRISKARRELGIETEDVQTLHMIFAGNPGTGKTTVARLVAELLYDMGVLASGSFVETDRAGMVAGYAGQTAIKTKQVIRDALDGVLFIDEAYALSSGAGQNDFGKEAIDTLVKDMDDNRGRLVVILAGYTREMEQFLAVNPGLASRFPNVIHFPDYSAQELLEIIRGMYASKHYALNPGAESKLLEVFEVARQDPQFGNGRYARNICERSIRNLSMRITRQGIFDRESLMTILAEDIEA